jgi:hypothetical protein
VLNNVELLAELRRMRWTGHVVHVVDKRSACEVLVEIPEG